MKLVYWKEMASFLGYSLLISLLLSTIFEFKIISREPLEILMPALILWSLLMIFSVLSYGSLTLLNKVLKKCNKKVIFRKAEVYLTALICAVSIYFGLNSMIWSYPLSYFPFLFLLPLFAAIFLSLILSFVGYVLFLPVFIIWVFFIIRYFLKLWSWLRNKSKFLLIFPIVFLLLFFGINEPIINSTINRPDLHCEQSSDCTWKIVDNDMCGRHICANEGWEKYQALGTSVFALSCALPSVACVCESNRCEEKNYRENTDLTLCEQIPEKGIVHQESCYQVTFWNSDDDFICDKAPKNYREQCLKVREEKTKK